MILDTNAVSAILKGDRGVVPVLAGTRRHELPVIVIGEYRYGLMHSRHRAGLEPLFERLVADSEVLRVDERTAATYARVRDDLKRQGTPIPENDVWIAALAVQHGLPIATNDSHFDHVPGLKRTGW